MSKLPFTPKMTTSFGTTPFGTTPGTLPGSTLDTGVEVDTGLDTSGTLAGATTSDPGSTSEFNQPTPSPALDREPGLDRRAFLRWGALGTAGLLVGCGSKKQQKPQVQTKPGKETGGLRKNVQLPPDGLTDPAAGYEIFAHPERTEPAIPKGFPLWGKIGIGIGAAALATGAFFGIRAARKARYQAIEGPELKYIMKADQWHDTGKSIQVRLATPVDGALSVTIDGIEEKLIRHFEEQMPPAKKRKVGLRYSFDIYGMLEAVGVTEKDEQKAIIATLKESGGAIDRGWLVKDDNSVGDFYCSTLTPYPRPNFIKRKRLLNAIRAKEEAAAKTLEAAEKAAESEAPAPAETVGDTTGPETSVKIDNHAFVRLPNGGYRLCIGDAQHVRYPAQWQGDIIGGLVPDSPGRTLVTMTKPVKASQAMVQELLEDLRNLGVLASGNLVLNSLNAIQPGIEYRITVPAVPQDKAEEKLTNDKGVRTFTVTATNETKSDTGGHGAAPDQGEPEAGTLFSEDETKANVPPPGISTLLGGSETPPAPPAEAPAIQGAPAPVAGPPEAAPPVSAIAAGRDLGEAPTEYAKLPDNTPDAATKTPDRAPAVTPHELDESDMMQVASLMDPLAFDSGNIQHTFEDEEAAVLRLTMDEPFIGDIGNHLASLDNDIDALEANSAAKRLTGTEEEPSYLVPTDEGLRVRPDLVEYFAIEAPESDAATVDPDDIVSEDADDRAKTTAREPEAARTTSPTIMTPDSAQKDLEAKYDLVQQAEASLENVKTALGEAKQAVVAARTEADAARVDRDAKEDAILDAVRDEEIEAAEAAAAEAKEVLDEKQAAFRTAQREARTVNKAFRDATSKVEAAKKDVEEAQNALDEAIKIEQAAAKAKEEAEKAEAEKAAAEAADAAKTQRFDRDKVKAALGKAEETAEVKIAREALETEQKAVGEAMAAVEAAQAEVDAKTAAVRSASKDSRSAARAKLSDANAELDLALDVLEATEENEEQAQASYEKAQQEAAEEAKRVAAEEAERAAAAKAARTTASGTVGKSKVDEGAMTQPFKRSDVDKAVKEAAGDKEDSTATRAAEDKKKAIEGAFEDLNTDETVTVPAIIGRGLMKLLKKEGYVKDEDFTVEMKGKQMTITLVD